MMDEKILKLIEDKDFLKKVQSCENSAEFSDIMSEYRVDLNGVDAETAYSEYKSGIDAYKENSNDELGETDLNAVSGGRVRGLFYWIGYGIGKLVNKRTGICG